ncbi:MAG: glutathionylspermidine synthase family protein [Bacteroidales bacterium]|nr:glutathionylspermidine synthase family protein [Bacteroidales bacterium]
MKAPANISTLNSSYLVQLEKHRIGPDSQLGFLIRFLLEHNCTFSGKPMPTLLKPNFVSKNQLRRLRQTVEVMSTALDKFIELYMENEEVRRIMKFSDLENELFTIDPGYQKPLVISRLDAFLNNDSVKFLEFNCDSPAGIAYADVLEEGFRELFKEYPLFEKWEIIYTRRQDLLLNSLLQCYTEYRSKVRSLPAKPVIAIVDWEGVSTYSEFQLLEKHFSQNGYKTVICSPQQFSIKNGRALARDEEVHLVYRRVITRELLQKWDQVGEFIQCLKDGLVCCCNSFRSYIVGNKKVLSLITDPRFQKIFSQKELQMIRETVPWTEILADNEVTFRDKRVHLRDFILSNKDLLVLKPANMYGGKNVYIGLETSQETWERVMNQQIEDESWVVQEYVDIPADIYPEIGDGISFKRKYVNINPFALLGKYSGAITRVSDSAVINVSAGGGLVPTLGAEPADT